MNRIAIVGDGPVGLASADQISRYFDELTTQLFFSNGPATHKAAAAFWTPFSSGTNVEYDALLSKETLKFYQELIDRGNQGTGVKIRLLKQFWLENSGTEDQLVPTWRNHNGLNFQRRPDGEDFLTLGEDPYRGRNDWKWRCECSYSTPVIRVPDFRRWYHEFLRTERNVEQVELTCPISQEDSRAWQQIKSFDPSVVVLAIGASTLYQNLWKASPKSILEFKKGVIAFVPSAPDQSEAVLLFEGGFFDTDSLYVVPHDDGYVIGGTISEVFGAHRYRKNAWTVSKLEKEGIRERARIFLPPTVKENLLHAGFWEDSNSIKWTAGVRPRLKGGPIIARSALAEEKLEVPCLVHFGHGGSGFTFCHDTAKSLCNEIRKLTGG